MKIIEVDDELYQYIASKTENIGEQASDILRRLLGFAPVGDNQSPTAQIASSTISEPISRDDEIEVVIPAEAESANSEVASTDDANVSASVNDNAIDGISADVNTIAEPQGDYQVNQSPLQDADGAEIDDNDVKTTTVKAQQAKHAIIHESNDQAEVSAQQIEASSNGEDESAAKTPVKTPRKAKTRRPPKAKPGPSKAQLATPVKGLDLPLIAENNSVVKRFMYILSRLEQKHGAAFKCVLQVQGKGRLYFATSEQALSEAGSNTNPKQIGNSTYWVMTNSNTDRKKQMLSEVSKSLGYDSETVEVLLAKL